MISATARDEICKQTKAIAMEIGFAVDAQAMSRIAAALIISHGMQTVDDVGPALKELAAAYTYAPLDGHRGP